MPMASALELQYIRSPPPSSRMREPRMSSCDCLFLPLLPPLTLSKLAPLFRRALLRTPADFFSSDLIPFSFPFSMQPFLCLLEEDFAGSLDPHLPSPGGPPPLSSRDCRRDQLWRFIIRNLLRSLSILVRHSPLFPFFRAAASPPISFRYPQPDPPSNLSLHF